MNGVLCVGCGSALPVPNALCPRCTAPALAVAPSLAGSASDPWGHEREGGTYFRRLVIAEKAAVQVRAVSQDLTSIAMILALAVMAVTFVAVFVPFATVDGAEILLATDRSAALALVASSLFAVLGVFGARAESGWALGLMAGSSFNVLLLMQRVCAGVLADGSTEVHWSTGFVLLSFAAVGSLMILLIALTGVRTGQAVTQVPSIVALPALAFLVAAIAIDRQNLMDVAYGLAAPARALTAMALFLEGVLWVSALASRSRLGAGMLFGSSAAWLVVAIDGAQPPRGLLATAGLSQPATVGAVGVLVVLAGMMMLLCAWPEDHPIRRSLTNVNDAAHLS